MKIQLYINGIIILSSILFFTSCIKNELEEPTLIIDPSPWFTHDAYWQEVEKKTGDADLKQIQEGNNLSLEWNQDGEIITSPFFYNYNSSNLGINLDKEGYLLMEKGIISFLKVKDGKTAGAETLVDTVIQVKYILEGEKLIIQDTTVSPVTEVIYKRLYP